MKLAITIRQVKPVKILLPGWKYVLNGKQL